MKPTLYNQKIKNADVKQWLGTRIRVKSLSKI